MAQKIALVTGAAQGIGLACAQALARDGGKVVAVDIQRETVNAAAQDTGHGAVGYHCDLPVPPET